MRAIGLLVIPRSSTGGGSGGGGSTPLILSAISPNLGDTFAGTPVTLTGTGLGSVTGVTINGVACSNVVAVSATKVTASAPALAAAGATYGAQATASSGSSNILANAYEAWSPLTDYPAARVFQGDRGTTAATAVTRQRAGAVSATMSGFIPRDGAAFLQLASGRILLVGGWNPAQFPASTYSAAGDVTNAILYSDDGGFTWATLLAHDSTPGTTRFLPGHNAATFVHLVGGVPYVYWIGSDANAGVGRDGGVWRALASALDVGGTAAGAFSQIATIAPTAGRSLYMYWSFSGAIYIMGGQTDLADATTAQQDVYRSTDNGLTWTTLTAAPWAKRTGPIGAGLVFGGYMWMIAGATYASTQAGRTYFNDVYKFDGTTWTQVLANGHSQFTGRHYHGLTLYKSKMWIVNGFALASAGNGERDAYSSSDGATWTQSQVGLNGASTSVMPWQGTHAHATLSLADGSGILTTSGQIDTATWRLVEHTGTLLSAWTDQGSGALSLAQAGASALRPVLDPTFFGSVPAVVLTGTESMSLAAVDRGIAGGTYEVWIVGRSLNTDAIAANTTIDPPAVLVGNTDAAAYNEFGFSAGVLEYHDGSITWHTTQRGSGLADDKCRLLGASHASGSLSLYVGTTKQGVTDTAVGFDTTFVGWNALGLGYATDQGAFAFGAIVILKTSAASSGAFRTKLNAWAKKWGSTT